VENKQQIISNLDQVYHRWLDLLKTFSTEQIQQPLLPSLWTVKDVIAHLWAWQQASVARANAALNDNLPDYPDWWKACGPDPDEDVDQTNAYIYTANRDKDWDVVFTSWNQQFQHYLRLLQQIPEFDLVQKGRYPWMGAYALADSANGSLDHHLEHYEVLTTWLKDDHA
jgi:hypothetical protein